MASSKDISPLRHLRARSFVSSGMWKPSASTEPTLLLTMAISSMVDCMIRTELNILIWASRTEGSRTYGVETYTTTGVRNRPTKIGQMRCRIKEAAPRAIDSEDRATSLCNGMEVSSTRDDNVASSIEHDLYLLQVTFQPYISKRRRRFTGPAKQGLIRGTSNRDAWPICTTAG